MPKMLFWPLVVALTQHLSAAALIQLRDGTGATPDVVVGGETWLLGSHGEPRVFALGAWQQLYLRSTSQISGADELGAFTGASRLYSSSDRSGVVMEASWKVYDESVGAIVFTQAFPHGLNGTRVTDLSPMIGPTSALAAGYNRPLSEYPSFDAQPPTPLGYLSYQGCTAQYPFAGRFPDGGVRVLGVPHTYPIAPSAQGYEGGYFGGVPLALFDNSSAKQPRALVLSPLDQPLETVFNLVGEGGGEDSAEGGVEGGVKSDEGARRLVAGPQALLTSLPAGYSSSTIGVVRRGVNRAFEAWGRLLRAHAGSDKPAPLDSLPPFLTHWGTDNGFYFYAPEEHTTYETTYLEMCVRRRGTSHPRA